MVEEDKNAPLKLRGLIEEDDERGVFRINRRMFTDPALFEMEMRYIFGERWVYLAHESQLPKPGDFVTSYAGRQPIIVSRQRDGSLAGFLNACSHRGAMLESRAAGYKKLFVCPFHAWSFANDGRLIGCGDMKEAGYGPGFSKEQLGLKPLGRVSSYRGFIFGRLAVHGEDLSDYLGGAKTFIDLIVDQDPNGEIELIPGPQTYTYDGNWKLQAENGVDGYHIGAIHGNYVLTTNNRARIAAGREFVEPIDVSAFSKFPGGYYAMENGHVVLWNEAPNPEVRPSFANRKDYVARFGDDRAKWMTDCWRNLFIFPNLFLMDQMSSQIRTFRPLTVNLTEVKAYAFAPKSEAPEMRAKRIRQYEDFFNASGMATPDDLAAFNATQAGFAATGAEWSDVSRGSQNLLKGADDRARKLGFEPRYCGTRLQDEGLYLNQHRHWLDILKHGVARDGAAAMEAAE